MEIIKILKINELHNLKENITQIGGLDKDLKLIEIESMHKEIVNKLNKLINSYTDDKRELIKLTDMIKGGGNEEKINIDKEYDFINKNIEKLHKFNKKYLSNNMKELQYQLNYSDDVFTDDLESLDDSRDSNYALAENLNYTKNAKKNNLQPINNLQLPQPILQPIQNVSNIDYKVLYEGVNNTYKRLYDMIRSI